MDNLIAQSIIDALPGYDEHTLVAFERSLWLSRRAYPEGSPAWAVAIALLTRVKEEIAKRDPLDVLAVRIEIEKSGQVK